MPNILEYDSNLGNELEGVIKGSIAMTSTGEQEQAQLIRDLLMSKSYISECDIKIRDVTHTVKGMFVQYNECIGKQYYMTVKFAPTAEYVEIACEVASDPNWGNRRY